MFSFSFAVPSRNAINWITECLPFIDAIGSGFSDKISRKQTTAILEIAISIYEEVYADVCAAQYNLESVTEDLQWLRFEIQSDEQTVHYR